MLSRRFTRTFIDAGSLAVVCNPVAGLTPPPAAASREFLGAPAAFWITGELSAPITTGETGRSVINSVAPACLSGQHNGRNAVDVTAGAVGANSFFCPSHAAAVMRSSEREHCAFIFFLFALLCAKLCPH